MNCIHIFACHRANLSQQKGSAKVQVHEVPCTGRISAPLLLTAFAQKADGVLVLGRHQETCRFNGAEDAARIRTGQVSRLLALLGLGAKRLQFIAPDPGPEGPRRAVDAFISEISQLGPSPLNTAFADHASLDESLDSAITLLRWLSQQSELSPSATEWLAEHRLPSPAPNRPMLVAGNLPYLDLLTGEILKPFKLTSLLKEALTVLNHLGHQEVGISISGYDAINKNELNRLREAPAVFALSSSDQTRLANLEIRASTIEDLVLANEPASTIKPSLPIGIAGSGSAAEHRLIQAIGSRLVEVETDPLPDTFRLTPEHRLHAERRLENAEVKGAQYLLVPDVSALVRWSLITRQGTWRRNRILPILAHQLLLLDRQAGPAEAFSSGLTSQNQALPARS